MTLNRKTTFLSQSSKSNQNISNFGSSSNTIVSKSVGSELKYFFMFYNRASQSKPRPIREDLREARSKAEQLEVFIYLSFMKNYK
jgi:hypothetical protein